VKKINDYYQKKQLVQQLSEELQKLEQDQALKRELEFEDKIRELMESHNKTARDVLQVLTVLDPSLAGSAAETSPARRAKRPMKSYKNPHTGEVVRTRGGNHKTLNLWREQYGKEAVQSWQQE